MKKILLALCLLLPGSALAQSVQQSGSVTPGHVPIWTTDGVIQDGGTAAQGFLTSLGVIASGTGICQNSGPITGPYNQICLNATSTGGGGLSLNNFGGATGGLAVTVNGVSQTLSLNTVLPSVLGDVVCYADTFGNVQGCGFLSSQVALKDGNNTFSGTNIFSGSNTFNSTFNCTGVCELNSVPFGTMATQNANDVNITGATAITGLPTPSNAADAATKSYVDNAAIGLNIHQAVRLATTAALSANTYNNGTAGVNATLTANGNGALTVDSVTAATNDRIIVKNEVTTSHNGIYIVTATGDGSNPYILTRTTDANTAGSNSSVLLGLGTFALATAGTVNTNTGWVVNSSVVTIGSSAVIWAQQAGGSAITSVNALTGAVSVVNGGGVNVVASGTSVNVNVAIVPPQGRLTLQTGTPVMINSLTNVQTVYYDCFNGGNSVPVYNGSIDLTLPIATCELADTMPSSSTGVTTSGGVFDEWATIVSSAVVICHATNGSGGGWASDTGGSNIVRGTGYSQLDTTTRPYITNKNALTHCYTGATDRGTISVNQATYLGTFFTTGNGQTSFSLGGSASGGAPAMLYLWNAYNQVDIVATIADNGTGYSYTPATIREARNSTGNQSNFVAGLAQQAFELAYSASESVTASGGVATGVCAIDSTIAFASAPDNLSNAAPSVIAFGHTNTAMFTPVIGKHFVAACERSNGTVTSIFGGGASSNTLSMKVRM